MCFGGLAAKDEIGLTAKDEVGLTASDKVGLTASNKVGLAGVAHQGDSHRGGVATVGGRSWELVEVFKVAAGLATGFFFTFIYD